MPVLHQFVLPRFRFPRPDNSQPCARRWGLHLGHAMLMAVHALYPMYVVRTGAICIGGIHLSNVQAAMRHLRMATGTGRGRALIVPGMTRDATQPFMHTDRRSVITGPNLWPPRMKGRFRPRFRLARSVTLIADALPTIHADSHHSILIMQTRNRERRRSKVKLLTTIKERCCVERNLPCIGHSRLWLCGKLPFAMYPMAGLAWHHRLVR